MWCTKISVHALNKAWHRFWKNSEYKNIKVSDEVKDMPMGRCPRNPCLDPWSGFAVVGGNISLVPFDHYHFCVDNHGLIKCINKILILYPWTSLIKSATFWNTDLIYMCLSFRPLRQRLLVDSWQSDSVNFWQLNLWLISWNAAVTLLSAEEECTFHCNWLMVMPLTGIFPSLFWFFSPL